MTALLVTDDADRDNPSPKRSVTSRPKFDRMPAHWEARRLEVMREIERLIERWLEL